MKIGAAVCLTLFLAGVLLSLLQLWLAPFNDALFAKLLWSLVGLFLASGATTLVVKEVKDERKLRDSGYLD